MMPVLASAVIFQSTLPMRGETKFAENLKVIKVISIHSPHAGRDNNALDGFKVLNISIHSPHAGRDLPE